MTYSVATHFNQLNWEKYGLNWLRKAKSEGLKGFIVGRSLTNEAQKKISSLGFEYIQNHLGLNFQLADLCGEHCLLTRCDVLPNVSLLEGKNVVCSVDQNINEIDLVWSLSNLNHRAKTILIIRDRIKDVYGGFFSARYILGSQKFWTNISEFEVFIHSQNGYLGGDVMRDELVLNLYFAFFKSIGVEAKND